jgi:hypothetical protein
VSYACSSPSPGPYYGNYYQSSYCASYPNDPNCYQNPYYPPQPQSPQTSNYCLSYPNDPNCAQNPSYLGPQQIINQQQVVTQTQQVTMSSASTETSIPAMSQTSIVTSTNTDNTQLAMYQALSGTATILLVAVAAVLVMSYLFKPKSQRTSQLIPPLQTNYSSPSAPQLPMNFCSRCGSKLVLGSLYCSACGTKL